MMRLTDLQLANPLFENWEETIIWSCLQGIMGEIFVDDLSNPKSALAKLGKIASFGFLAGEPSRELIESCRGEDIILVPQNEAWSRLIQTTYGDKAKAFTRYATKKESSFDPLKLQTFVDDLAEDFEICQIDERLYRLCLQEKWSQDLVSNYDDYTHYDRFGLGYVILHKNRLVAGASSYSSYRGGIEIEIDTHPEYRQQGLAKAVASKLILKCLERNLYPSWDAHTKISLHLAQQLGYHYSHDYIAYEIDWSVV